MLKSEELYETVKSIQTVSASKAVPEALVQVCGGSSVSIAADTFLSLIDDARNEVENCHFVKSGKQMRFLGELSSFRASVLDLFLRRDPQAKGKLFNEGAIERIGGIADAVSERIEVEVKPIDRAEFAEVTQRLINEVSQWNLGQYASRSLLLGLELISQMLTSESVSITDADVRRRITRLVAAFAIEFAELDKEFETRWETIKRWARFGFRGASVPLALTSDAAGIAGLLPKP